MSKSKRTKRRSLIFKLCAFLAVIAVCLGIIGYFGASLTRQTTHPREYSDLVEQNAAEYGLEEQLLYAVIRTESGFNPDAVSSADAKGLTQITPDTFKWLQTKTAEELEDDSLFTPEVSIRYGAFFLGYLIEEFGNTETALAAYHAGRGIVNEWLENSEYSSDGIVLDKIPYKDTERYVEKVITAYKQYNKLYYQ